MDVINGNVLMTCEQYNTIRAKFGDEKVRHDGDGFHIINNRRMMYLNKDLTVKKLGTLIMIKNNKVKLVHYNSAFREGYSSNNVLKIKNYMSQTFKTMLKSEINFEISEFNNGVYIYYVPHTFNKFFINVKVFKNNELIHEEKKESEYFTDVIVPLPSINDSISMGKYSYTSSNAYVKCNDKYFIAAFHV